MRPGIVAPSVIPQSRAAARYSAECDVRDPHTRRAAVDPPVGGRGTRSGICRAGACLRVRHDKSGSDERGSAAAPTPERGIFDHRLRLIGLLRNQPESGQQAAPNRQSPPSFCLLQPFKPPLNPYPIAYPRPYVILNSKSIPPNFSAPCRPYKNTSRPAFDVADIL